MWESRRVRRFLRLQIGSKFKSLINSTRNHCWSPSILQTWGNHTRTQHTAMPPDTFTRHLSSWPFLDHITADTVPHLKWLIPVPAGPRKGLVFWIHLFFEFICSFTLCDSQEWPCFFFFNVLLVIETSTFQAILVEAWWLIHPGNSSFYFQMALSWRTADGDWRVGMSALGCPDSLKESADLDPMIL